MFLKIFKDFLNLARFIPPGALACRLFWAGSGFSPGQPFTILGKIYHLGTFTLLKMIGGLRKADFFNILTHFLSNGLLQVFCGVGAAYFGALNSWKCVPYFCKTTHFVLL